MKSHIASIFLLSLAGSNAASIGIIYNTANLSGGPLGIKTSVLPIGYASPAITDVVGSTIVLSGLTEDGNNANGFAMTGVPTTVDLTKYAQFTLTPDSGIEFAPSEIKVALASFDSRFDGNAGYEVRSSQDSFGSVVAVGVKDPTSGRNTISGTSIRVNFDFEADVSALSPTTDPITFRLYFTDDDGVVSPPASSQTFLYGFQFFGNAADVVPEPSAALLGVLGAFMGLSVRRRTR